MAQPGKGGHAAPHVAAPIDGRKAGSANGGKGDTKTGIHPGGTHGKGK